MWQGICPNYYPLLCALVVSRLSSKGKTPQNPTPETKKLEAIDGKIAPFYWGGFVTSRIYQVRPFLLEFGLPPRGARGPLPKSRKRRYCHVQISKIRFTYKNQNISKIDFLLFKLSRLDFFSNLESH